MNYLYILNDITSNGYKVAFLDIFYFISIFLGVYIIISKNPVVSVLFLIGLFSTISGYLILVGLNFIGISYVLVYVGAVSILFIFILMLINIRISELLNETNNTLPLGIITVINFDYIIGQVIPFNQLEPSFIEHLISSWFEFFYTVQQSDKYFNIVENKQSISLASASNWDTALVDITDITSVGNIMYTSYSIWLVITSIILLLAMVGAIVITIKQK
jgi:NADH-ubiquinone oxidoreductase chain 6